MSPERAEVKVKVLSANDQVAAGTREWLFGQGLFALNLIPSPGSGKTTPNLVLALDTAIANARSIDPELEVHTASSFSGVGLEAWTGWLTELVAAQEQSTRRAGS